MKYSIRKLLALFLCIAMVLTVVLSGCSPMYGDDEDDWDEEEEEENEDDTGKNSEGHQKPSEPLSSETKKPINSRPQEAPVESSPSNPDHFESEDDPSNHEPSDPDDDPSNHEPSDPEDDPSNPDHSDPWDDPSNPDHSNSESESKEPELPDAPEADSVNDFLFEIFGDECTVIAYIGSSDNVVIPSKYFEFSVTAIGEGAFMSNDSVKKVVIPEGVKSIGASAFLDCSNLESVILPNSLESVGSSAFDYSFSINGTLYNEGKYLGNNENPYMYFLGMYGGFEGTTLDLHEDTRFIGDGALDWHQTLEIINIPDGVVSIGDKAFENCSNLRAVNISNYSNLTNIGNSAFYGCSHLTDISIPDGIEMVGMYAFDNCDQLQFNYYDDARYLGNDENPFLVLVGLYLEDKQYCEIHSSARVIAPAAFRFCHELWEINIPDSIVTIGEEAFLYCYKVSNLYIGSSVENIGAGAFDGFSALRRIVVSSGNNKYHSDENCMIEIAGKTLVLGCATSIIPSDGSVTSISSNAFANSDITDLYIPASINVIATSAFKNCTKLSSITVEEGNETYHSAGNCLIDTEGKTVVLGCQNSVIPDDGSVTIIGKYAFEVCIYLTDITIPYGIEIIEERAFKSCERIEIIIIPDSVTTIGSAAFEDCVNLSNITIPDSVTDLGTNVFYGCYSLGGAYIGRGISEIPGHTFSNCSSLTSIDIPDNIEKIGESAFYACTILDNVKIGSGVKTIDSSAFAYCQGLWEITIPENVTSIERDVFSGCNNLKNVIIEGEIETINPYLFTFCENLTSIVIPASVKKVDYYSFGEIYQTITVYFMGTYDEWINISVDLDGNDAWKNANVCYYSETEPADNEYNYWYYFEGVPTQW